MKKLFLFLVLSLFANRLFALTNEVLIRAYCGTATAVSVSVKVFYQQNGIWRLASTNNIPCLGQTDGEFGFNDLEWNGGFDTQICGNEGRSLFTLDSTLAKQGVKIVIDNRAINWRWQGGASGTGDTKLYYNQNTGVITAVHVGSDSTYSSSEVWDYYAVAVKNSFDGGQIRFSTESAPENVPSGGYLIKVFSSNQFPVTVTALPDQPAADYYTWLGWDISNESLTRSLTIGDHRMSADFERAERLTFEDTGVMIDNINIPPGQTFKAKLNNTKTITLSSDIYKSMLTSIDHWTKDGNAYGATASISYTPTSQKVTTFRAYRSVIKPVNDYRGQNNSTVVGQPITIRWHKHPYPTGITQYKVYRKIKNVQSSRCIATVGANDSTYTDNQCLYTSGYTDNLIYYDVRAYYEPLEMYTDEDFTPVFGDYNPNRINDDKKGDLKISGVIPTAYALGNYPNPFNPTTVIQYALPEAGQVSLKVYNILSQEVADLVNETQSAGIHQVSFNARNLPTGIYIARLQAGSKVMSVKLQLIK